MDPDDLDDCEMVVLKDITYHHLTKEFQQLYNSITKSCIDPSDPNREHYIEILANSPAMSSLIPHICQFIKEEVEVNIVLKNLAQLTSLINMVEALIKNEHIFLDAHLHYLVPAVLSCIVCKQFCKFVDFDTHWNLRNYAAKIAVQLCNCFSKATNSLEERIISVFSDALENRETDLCSIYGCLIGLAEMGDQIVISHILPNIKNISSIFDSHNENPKPSHSDVAAVGYIRVVIKKFCVPVLRYTRMPPDLEHAYRLEFGSLGSTIRQAVIKSRNKFNGNDDITMTDTPQNGPDWNTIATGSDS